MSERTHLLATADDWHDLAKAIDRARDGSKFVSVPKDALDRLMKDHSKLIDLHKPNLTGAT